eukprot:2094397-Amphidinium_carterae.2
MHEGWQCDDQCFTFYEADQRVKWDSIKNLLAEVAANRPDFQGLETGRTTGGQLDCARLCQSAWIVTCASVTGDHAA